MKERWVATKNANGAYDFVVSRAPIPILGWLYCILMIPLFGIGIIGLVAYFFIQRMKARFTVDSSGFVVKGKRIPLDRVNQIEIRNSVNRVVYESGLFVGGGAAGYVAAGGLAAGNAFLSAAASATQKVGYLVAIQTGAQLVKLATALREHEAERLNR